MLSGYKKQSGKIYRGSWKVLEKLWNLGEQRSGNPVIVMAEVMCFCCTVAWLFRRMFQHCCTFGLSSNAIGFRDKKMNKVEDIRRHRTADVRNSATFQVVQAAATFYVEVWLFCLIQQLQSDFYISDVFHVVTEKALRLRERRKHCGLAVVRRSQKFSPRRRPPSRGRRTAKI